MKSKLLLFLLLYSFHSLLEKKKALEKVAFFLAATTFSFAIATPFALSIKCAIWAVYIMSLITIAICTCLSVVVFGILKCNIPHVEI